MNNVARGGTELMEERIKTLPSNLLEKFQITHSRIRQPLDETKKQILVLHDLPLDPENDHLKNGGWAKFDKLVFVSHWQQEQYAIYLGVPYSAGTVIKNAIKRFDDITNKPDDRINLVYFSTPHRGLNILYESFKVICQYHQDVYLNVYSSFDLYGWGQRDTHYQQLFDNLASTPKVSYNKSISNEQMREVLKSQHILAYPNIWQETSCLVLIEAMCAGLRCVHPNYAALTETSMGLTDSYQYNENMIKHFETFTSKLLDVISDVKNNRCKSEHLSLYNDVYDWEKRKVQWIDLLVSLE